MLMRFIRATDSCPRTRTSPRSARRPGSFSSVRSADTMRVARQQGGGAQPPPSPAGVPVMPATKPLPLDAAECRRLAHQIGYPDDASRHPGAAVGAACASSTAMRSSIDTAAVLARREAKAAFGNDEVYLEKLVVPGHAISKCRSSATVTAIWCTCTNATASVQRRNQKVVEPARRQCSSVSRNPRGALRGGD